ncbi:MAG: FHA domain-containing protein [Burkholderiales bacterium]|nr:FHA domain-containing protein [Burkholderiales bacterium]MCA3162081.1 FHA domain-containing protein [Burkholderiales bacterium]MCA3165628.1 FHA domain-containing protein [Burkholderiales bacterium]MCA3169860.1 FHA domain-containing protein [Burkholderiales bacterium]MCA3172117.1 FHA domain-containing protein [Burkholderiales bacterium]
MAKLVLSVDGVTLREVPLSKERMTLGRKPQNDIVIDNIAVSAEHAVIVTLFNDSFLEDLGSTNGTFVNGQPVKKHFLQNGDTIELGKYRLKFIADADMAVQSYRQSPASLAETSSMQPLPSPNNETPAVIRLLSGAAVGRELKLTKALTTLGRPGVQVAVITRRPQGYYITHVQGIQFPVVNGNTLGAEAHPLNDRDVFELSGMKMEFLLRP